MGEGGCHAAPAGETLFVWSVLDRGFWLAGIVSFPIVVSHEKEAVQLVKTAKVMQRGDAITGVPPTDDNPIRGSKLTRRISRCSPSPFRETKARSTRVDFLNIFLYTLHDTCSTCLGQTKEEGQIANGGELNAAKCTRRVSYYIRP